MSEKKAIRARKVLKATVAIAVCVILMLTVCFAGCKVVYDEQNIFLAANNAILNGAKADISYTISEDGTVVYSYKNGEVEIASGLESYITAVVPSFEGMAGLSFSPSYLDKEEVVFNNSEGTYVGSITDTRGFWGDDDKNAGNYKKATIKLIAECKSAQLKYMEINYTYSGFDINIIAKYDW